jgi:hypothetical protein
MTLPEALQRLHAAGKIRSPWLGGMAFNVGRGHIPIRFTFGEVDDGDWLPTEHGYTPDLTDPATIGALTALVREASGDEYARARYSASNKEWHVYYGWAKIPFKGLLGRGETEGAALSAALIALAEGL